MKKVYQHPRTQVYSLQGSPILLNGSLLNEEDIAILEEELVDPDDPDPWG